MRILYSLSLIDLPKKKSKFISLANALLNSQIKKAELDDSFEKNL